MSAIKRGSQSSRRPLAKSTISPAQVECLEPRLLLSVSTAWVDQTLTIRSDDADAITVTDSGGNVAINGTALDIDGAVSSSAVKSLLVWGGPGDNLIDLSGLTGAAFTALTSVGVDAGDGDDTITGSPLADVLRGGAGDDGIDGGEGDDTLAGGLGNDQLTGGLGTDTVAGGGGSDVEDGEVLSANDFSSLGADLQTYLQNVQDSLDGVFARPLPFVGDQLAGDVSVANGFISDPTIKGQFVTGGDGFASDLGAALTTAAPDSAVAVQTAMFAVLGPAGLGLLSDTDASGAIDIDDVQWSAQADGDVLFNTVLTRDLADNFSTGEAAFILGLTFGRFTGQGVPDEPIQWRMLDWLNEGKAKDADLALGYRYALSFGLSEDGFYERPGAADELTVELESAIPDLQDRNTFQAGRLQVTASDFPGSGGDLDAGASSFSGIYTMDVLDGGALRARLNGQAQANLLLDGKFFEDDSLPINLRALSHFHMNWSFVDADPAADPELFGQTPTVGFDEVQLDLDSFFGGFASGIITQVQKVTKPIAPLIDVLSAELPVISDLGGPANLAELIGGESLGRLVDLVDFINAIHVPESGDLAGAFIPMGSFTLTDPRSGSPVILDYTGNPDALSDAQDEYESIFNPNVTIGVGKGPFFAEIDPNAEDGMSLPLLTDPAQTFNLFAGQDAVLFLYDLPVISAGVQYEQFFSIFGPLGTTIGGSLGVAVDLKFGYDTFGLAKYQSTGNWYDILDGFYVFDRPVVGGTTLPDEQDTGDPAEFTISAELGATLEVNLAGFIRAGVWGGVFGDVQFNLNDLPDAGGVYDGRVRYSELAINAQRGPEAIFDVCGALNGGLKFFLNVEINIDLGFWSFTITLFSYSKDLVNETLLDFNYSSPAVPPPPVAFQDALTGDLTLNPDAGGSFSNDDIFFVGPIRDELLGDGVRISSRGDSQDFYGVGTIRGDAGSGKDLVVVMPGVKSDAVIRGGADDDQLVYLGTGRAELFGDAGNDSLRAAKGADVLDGGDGDDVLASGDGNDRLFGGDGHDNLRGEAGDDLLNAGSGDDVIEGGRDNDNILAGDGIDEILWALGDGSDTIDGGANPADGNDLLTIHGGRNDDTLNVTGAVGAAQVEVLGFGTMNVAGVEALHVLLGAGADNLALSDLSASGIRELQVDMGDLGVADAMADRVSLNASDWNDVLGIDVSRSAGGEGLEQDLSDDDVLGEAGDLDIEHPAGDFSMVLVVQGLAYSLTIAGQSTPLDGLAMMGSQGDDEFRIGLNVPSIAGIMIDGQGGSDTLVALDETNVFEIVSPNAGHLNGLDGTRFVAIENLVGGNAADTFIFDDGASVDGTINGRDGTDTLDYSPFSNAVSVDLLTGAATGVNAGRAGGVMGIENLIGGAANDFLAGDDRDNMLIGNAGRDELLGRAGADTVDYADAPGPIRIILGGKNPPGAGNTPADGWGSRDRLRSIENVVGSAWDDFILGSIGPNLLDGGAGNDVINGLPGDDRLIGGPGDDILQGGAGIDILNVSEGNDTVRGGARDVVTTVDVRVFDKLRDELLIRMTEPGR